MRLYKGKNPMIAEAIIKQLVEDGDLETLTKAEAQLDIEAVLNEYVRQERQVVDEAKSLMEQRGLPYSQLGKMKSMVARERGLSVGDEMLPYVLEQLLTILFHSQNIEEIYAEDHVLRRKITTIMKRHLENEGELDAEVRSKIKNLQEGTATFEIEYQRQMDELKRKKRLT